MTPIKKALIWANFFWSRTYTYTQQPPSGRGGLSAEANRQAFTFQSKAEA